MRVLTQIRIMTNHIRSFIHKLLFTNNQHSPFISDSRTVMDKSLLNYKELLCKMISENNPGIIDNESRQHAVIVIQEFIRSAKKSIYIQCTHLSDDIYGNTETQKLIREALNRGVDIKILVRDKSPVCASFANEINAACNNTIFYPKECHKLDFCVVDGTRFRLEKDTDKGTAFVGTYNSEIAEALESYIQLAVNVS